MRQADVGVLSVPPAVALKMPEIVLRMIVSTRTPKQSVTCIAYIAIRVSGAAEVVLGSFGDWSPSIRGSPSPANTSQRYIRGTCRTIKPKIL